MEIPKKPALLAAISCPIAWLFMSLFMFNLYLYVLPLAIRYLSFSPPEEDCERIAADRRMRHSDLMIERNMGVLLGI
jgi:hypothetical protein